MSAPHNLVFDDVVIDFAGRRLLRGGAEQALEPKAFSVLALLAASPGRLFTRDEILDAVWGHTHVTPGVLNRIVTLLRQALAEDAQHPRLLRTVYGIGYRFDLPATAVATLSATATEADMQSVAPSSPTGRARERRSGFLRNSLWLLPLLVLLVFLAGWKFWPHPKSTPPQARTQAQADRSIAVLPLVNASNDPNQQFFSDGLSESLIGALSHFDGLNVIGPTSSFQFRDGRADSKAIGAKLGVAYLVSGSVQRAGNAVRIYASLTRAADGTMLWAEHYDRPYKDLFALQDDITQAVAAALQAKLLSPDLAVQQSDRPPSGNIDAYNAYLQGLKHGRDQDFPRAVEYMTQAVQLDPDYAAAWAYLSGASSTIATFSNEAPTLAREQMRQARFAADKALQLAPGRGSAHAALAYLQFYGFDHRNALAGCRRAVQLSPDDGTVLNGCAFVLEGAGKLSEAIGLRERLHSIEPLYAVNAFNYGHLLLASGRLDEAQKYLHLADGLSQPGSSPSHQFMYLAIARGDTKTALEAARSQRPPWREMNLAIAMQMSPDRAAANAAMAKALQNEVLTKTSPYFVAQAYALRGDADKTIEWLAHAPAHDLLFLLADPLILRFRDDPRLVAFCRKIGLPPPSQSEALSIDQIRASLAAKR